MLKLWRGVMLREIRCQSLSFRGENGLKNAFCVSKTESEGKSKTLSETSFDDNFGGPDPVSMSCRVVVLLVSSSEDSV